MNLNIKGHLLYYTFDHIRLPHLFSTKHGGVSTGEQASMNLDFAKDSRENVIKNFQILSTLGFDFETLTSVSQRHTSLVLAITNDHAGNNISTPNYLEISDGIITNDNNLTLVTSHADCQALYFYDPVKQAIGLAHSGWRGVADNIADNTVKEMRAAYGTNPADLLVGISPSIGYCCFEVDTPVKDEFLHKLPFSKKHMTPFGEKTKIDLPTINKVNLTNAGVLEQNIEIAPICTCCNSELFHSHRRSGLQRGCMVAMLRL